MPKLILIVDDSSTVRHQLRTFLTENGFDILEAENGQAGLAQATDNQPDLMLVDVNMPLMNGIDMVRKVRELPQHQKTPIFMLTTESSKQIVDAGKAAGATAWIVKPFKPEILIKGLNKVLKIS